MLALMAANSDDEAVHIASTYLGVGFLVDLTGLDDCGMLRISGQSALLYISSVIRGPFLRYSGCGF